MEAELKSRLKDRIEKKIYYCTSGCWIWLGMTDRHGYGKLKFNRKFLIVHRASWVVFKGEVPKGIIKRNKSLVKNYLIPLPQ